MSIQLEPEDGRTYQSYGSCLLNFGLYNKGIEILQHCHKLKYKNKGKWQFYLSLIYFYIKCTS